MLHELRQVDVEVLDLLSACDLLLNPAWKDQQNLKDPFSRPLVTANRYGASEGQAQRSSNDLMVTQREGDTGSFSLMCHDCDKSTTIKKTGYF